MDSRAGVFGFAPAWLCDLGPETCIGIRETGSEVEMGCGTVLGVTPPREWWKLVGQRVELNRDIQSQRKHQLTLGISVAGVGFQ